MENLWKLSFSYDQIPSLSVLLQNLGKSKNFGVLKPILIAFGHKNWCVYSGGAFRATIGGRFAPLATLVDEDADLDSMVTHFNKAETDTAAELLGKQRRKRKPWVTPEILDLCDQRRDLKKKRGEPEGAKDYREIKREIRTEMKMAKETWIQGQCQEAEACFRKNNSKKAY